MDRTATARGTTTTETASPEIPQLQSQSLGLRSFFKTSAYSRITLQYNTVMEYRRGGDRLDLPPHEAMIAEQTDHNINGGSLSFDLSSADFSNRVNVYASFQHIARKSYYGSKQDPDAYGRTHDLTVATGAQYIHSFDRLWFLPADLTLGVEYNYNDLDDESIGYDYRTKQKVHIIGAYLQNEWKNEHWSLLIGGRLDKHSLVDHVIFSPRANLRYNPGEGASLRLSYSSGFRAPQAFDEDMHIAIVGGERVRIRLADDLREERSHSLSLSADLYHRFGKVQTNLLVEGFYTTLDHVFALRPLPDPDTDREYDQGALQRLGRPRHGHQYRRQGRLHPLVRPAGRNHPSAEPLQGTGTVERRSGGRTDPQDVPHAEHLRLPYG